MTAEAPAGSHGCPGRPVCEVCLWLVQLAPSSERAAHLGQELPGRLPCAGLSRCGEAAKSPPGGPLFSPARLGAKEFERHNPKVVVTASGCNSGNWPSSSPYLGDSERQTMLQTAGALSPPLFGPSLLPRAAPCSGVKIKFLL